MDELDQIRSKINIVDFINEYVPLKKAGRNFRANCPFHSEKTPSFIVSPERQIWHCFGACGEGGDIFRFLMKWDNLEFPEALRILAKRAGVPLKEYVSSDASRLTEKLYQVNHLASEFYHYLLLHHPSGKRALDYVLGRGISKKSIELFKLGWAPNLWEGVSQFLVKKKGYKMADLDQAGLLVKTEKGWYDRFRGRLIFTLKNHRGEVVGFAGRTLDPQTKEAKYINTPETPLYVKGNILYGLDLTREAIKKDNSVIIVEGEIDLIQVYQAGSQNVVAIKGSALTEGQVNLIKRYSENIALALDTDLAGDAAARRGIEIADQAGLNIRVVQLEQGKDPDECLRQGPKLWFTALKKAVPFYDFLIDSAFSRHENETAEGAKKIGQELLPALAKITNAIVRAHYVKKLAQRLAVAEEVILEEMAKAEKGREEKTLVGKPRGKTSREETIEEYLLGLVLQSPDPWQTMNYFTSLLDQDDSSKYFLTPALKKIFVSLKDFLTRQGKKFQIRDFVKIQPKELVETIDRLYLRDLGEILTKEQFLKLEVAKIAQEMKILTFKRKLKNLSQKIRQTQSEEEISQLTNQFQKTSEELKALN